MATYATAKALWDLIKGATVTGENTATRVGEAGLEILDITRRLVFVKDSTAQDEDYSITIDVSTMNATDVNVSIEGESGYIEHGMDVQILRTLGVITSIVVYVGSELVSDIRISVIKTA